MGLKVEVKDETVKKLFLGGWKNICTGIIYHNAESQTGPLVSNDVVDICSREVQCINIKDNFCQPKIDRATQMWRSDCYISSETDKYKTAKKYETYKERQLRLDKNARIIQRSYRSWKMIKTIRECASLYKKMFDECKKFEEERDELLKKRNILSIIRMTFPQSRSDFKKIYALLDSWRKIYSDKLRKRSFEADAVAENCRMLGNMVEILKVVDEHRRIIIEEHKRKQLESFLTFHCKPVQWVGYKGKIIEMVTLRVQKARESKSLYDKLNSRDFSTEDRRDLLMNLKRSLELHCCYPALYLIELIEQEMMLCSRRIRGFNYLKRRISMAFLYFIRHNHGCCVNDSNDMELSEPIEIDKLLCRSCMRILSRKQFVADARVKKLSTCQYCFSLCQQNVKTIDYDPYMHLLNVVRVEELEGRCFSFLLHIIQKSEIYHLVKNIWHGHSIVSEADDIFNLRLVRFHINAPWTPWNCILLTEEESKAHYFGNNIEFLYSRELLHKISLIHQVARSHFKNLVKLEKKFQSSPRYRMVIEEEEIKI